MSTTMKKSMSNTCIPEEVLIEILARLPVKSLLRFRSVCKSWYSLITNPSFITTHLNRTKSNHTNKLLIKFKSENQDRCLSFIDDETFGDEFVKFEYPFQNYNEFFKIIGSCDGLLCLSDYYGSDYAILWNPSIRRFMTLLESGSFVTEDCRWLCFDFGFGFNHMSNDYNVVKIACAFDDHRLYVVHRVELFVLSTGSWRSVCIVDEVFREIALPNHQIDVNVRTNMYITVLGESLAVIIYEDDFASVKMIRTNHVWIGNVLMVQDGQTGLRELVSGNTQSRQIKHLGLHGDSFYVNTYMESLVALDVADRVWKSHVRPNFS
ncbi:hypothetical protein ACSBR2_011909 [Camellia fascicularis]